TSPAAPASRRADASLPAAVCHLPQVGEDSAQAWSLSRRIAVEQRSGNFVGGCDGMSAGGNTMRKLKVLAGLAAAMGLFILASPAAALDLPSNGMTATELANWLIQKGLPAQVKPDPTTPGDQIVSTSTDGIDVDIYLYDCSGEGNARRCTSM